MQIYIVLIVGC